MWADMAQLGLNHSRMSANIISMIKTLLEQHSDLSAAIVGMPNTPKYGHGQKPDKDEEIRSAVADFKTAVKTYDGMESRGVFGVIDPETMYSPDRPVTVEFMQLLSDTKDGDELKSMFRKGYTWRRGGIPELIKILHSSQFQDWSSKLSAASRGHVGNDKERKSWSSGRGLYRSVLKYIFEGMGARIVIQHIAAWDHELGMACAELNAARNSNMPTLTYVGTGWGEAHNVICQNIQTRIADELGHQIETGKYIIPGYDADVSVPVSTKARPVLDDNNFSLCCPRHSSKELAILETEITRVKRVFSIDPVLAQQVEAAIEKFNRENNPSGVPWKERRPNPGEEVATAESKS